MNPRPPSPRPVLTDIDEVSVAIQESVNPQEKHAAVVFNSHITGLAVARSLGRHGVPVIALDRDPKGYALASTYATISALCPNVLTDEDTFIAYLLEIGRALDRPGVLYPTNDEWVLAVNRHRDVLQEHFLIPFSGPEIVEPVLDKARLYRTATDLTIPIPRTWYPESEHLDDIVRSAPYPCIVKPTEQRSFYDQFGEKAWRIESPDDFRSTLERASGHPMVAQEIVGQGLTDFYSVCSYIGQDGEAHGMFVGRKLEQYPVEFGTGCLVVAEHVPAIAERGAQILKAFGYRGISEIEFIYDARDGEHKLLDINTRVWKWIGLPIASGIDLPWLAYADVTGTPEVAGPQRDGIVWTYAKDYTALRLEGQGNDTVHYVPEHAWANLLTGQSDPECQVVDAVLDHDDPCPAGRMMHNLFNPSRYFCAC